MSRKKGTKRIEKILQEESPYYYGEPPELTDEEIEESYKWLQECEEAEFDEFVDSIERIIKERTLSNEELTTLEYEFLKMSRTDIGQYFSPQELGDFIVNLPIVKDADIIFDPVCGTGSFLSKIKKINSKVKCFGVDIDPRVIKIAKALAKKKKQKISFFCQDSLDKYDENIPHPDVIFAELPFGVRVNKPNSRNEFEIQSNRLEDLLIEKIIKTLKKDSLAFIIVPEAILSSFDHSIKLHKYIHENSSLEAIFSLPRGIFSPYTAAKTSILVIRKTKRKGFTVLYEIDNLKGKQNTIIDFHNYLNTGKSNLAQISKDHDLKDNWSLIHYNESQKYQKMLSDIHYDFKLTKLDELCEVKRKSYKELQSEEFNFDLLIDRNCTIIENSLDLKIPNHIDYKRYTTIKVISKLLLPEYLKILFLSDFGVKENQMLLSRGIEVKDLDINLLREFNIPLLSIEKQNEIIKSAIRGKELISKNREEITIIQNIIKKRLFEKNAFTDLGTKKTEAHDQDYYQKLPFPIAHGVMIYKNVTNIDKKYENLGIALELIIKTLGAIMVCSLNNVADDEIVKFLRKEIDITRPISLGVWMKIIIRGVKNFEKTDSFLSNYSNEIPFDELNNLLNSLVSKRNSKSHSFNALSQMRKEEFVKDFENELDRLINVFTFLIEFPLIKIQGTDRTPHSLSHTVTYLTGDNRIPNEAMIEQQEDFMSTLYLYSKEQNKSLQLFPLLLYENCELEQEKDIFFFMNLDKKGEPMYKSLLRGSEIVKPECRDDIYKSFYFKGEKEFVE